MSVQRLVGDVRLRAHCAPWRRAQAQAVLAAFERSGTVRAGAEIAFGWSRLRLADGPDGALVVCEPDLRRWPTSSWMPTIDVTLDVLAAQVELLRRTGADGTDVALDDLVMVAPGVLLVDRIFLRRDAPVAAGDSGWSVGPVDNPDALSRAARLEPIAVGALVSLRPGLLPALTLPHDWIAVLDEDALTDVFDAAGRRRL